MQKFEINYHPIGIIHTPHKTIEDMPIQPVAAKGMSGSVDIFPKYIPALKDVKGFSHIYLIYHFHRVKSWKPLVTPFLDKKERGLFATRAPKRPNPIGLSVVRLINVKNEQLEIENVDMLDGTPLLDIKPYIPTFDTYPVISIGWLKDVRDDIEQKRSDERFG